jgi:hypothetical protein
MRQLILIWLLWGCICGFVRADSSDDLSKSKAAYEETLAKQKELLSTAFERKLADVRRMGDLDGVEQLTAEHERFQADGGLPESTVMKSFVQKYTKAVDTAKDRLKASYEKQVKALTRAEKIQEAQEIQRQLDRILSGKGDAEEPQNTPEPENVPEASEETAITFDQALWRYDGVRGAQSNQELNATRVFQEKLSSEGRFDVTPDVLGTLGDKDASRSLYLALRVFRVPVHLRLAEGSSIVFGTTGPDDENKRGTRMGNTRLELMDVTWKSDDAEDTVDLTKPVLERLLKEPVEIVPPLFPGDTPKEKMRAVFRFRTGPQTVEFHAAATSIVMFPMNLGITYPIPWQKAVAGPALQVRFRKAMWRHDGRIGTPGQQSEDVTHTVGALLNTKKQLSVDMATLGTLDKEKTSKTLSLDVVINGVELDFQLTEGSRLSLMNATDEERQVAGTPLGKSPVIVQDFQYQVLDESESSVTPEMLDALLSGDCTIEEPVFQDFAPGKKKLANLRLRVSGRIVKIGAAPGSVLKWKLESDTTSMIAPPTAPEQLPGLEDDNIAKPVDVLSQINIRRHRIKGEWSRKGRDLISPNTAGAMLELPLQATPSYEMDLEVERIGSTVESFNIAFPIDGNWGMVVLDGYEGVASGLNLVNGQKALVNPTRYQKPVFRSGKNQIQLKVTPKTVVVEVNGTTIVNWAGNPMTFSIEYYWSAGEGKAFIGTWNAEYIVSRIHVRSL